MTYTMITTYYTATETRTETNTRLGAGDVEMLKDTAQWMVEQGDTIEHRVIEER